MATASTWHVSVREHTHRNSGKDYDVTSFDSHTRNPTASVVFVGRNRRGNWVAREQSGTFGGLFVSRAQAFKYALIENDHRPDTVVEVLHEIELDIPVDPPIAGTRCVP